MKTWEFDELLIVRGCRSHRCLVCGHWLSGGGVPIDHFETYAEARALADSLGEEFGLPVIDLT